jgi:monovalent cation:H+ antiporter, CPA1 family
MLNIIAIFLTITALLTYVNHRFMKLPTTIGVMTAALLMSLVLVGLNTLGWAGELHALEVSLLHSIDFSEVLMQGMLSMLLFAGALHINLSELKAYRWQVASLAVVSTLLSTAAVGFGLWWVLPWLGLSLPLMYCLLFGALISPTDPIAVMGILKSANAPHQLELVIAGESLFNDGVGVVVFTLLLGMLASGVAPTLAQGGGVLLHEVGGGVLLGLVLGYVCFRMLKSVDNYQVEVLLTLALVIGGYALATTLHVSGPLAMVVAGLIIGNQARAWAMSDITRQYVDMFWELMDEILNALLFVLIGMEVLLVSFSLNVMIATGVAVLITLLARTLTVGMPVRMSQAIFNLPAGSWKVLTWGGLRGGISVALALSLPAGPERDMVVALTYGVVVFSILVQGLTIGRVTQKAMQTPPQT